MNKLSLYSLILSSILFLWGCEAEEIPAKKLGSFKIITANGMVKFKLVQGIENKVISTTFGESYYNVGDGILSVNAVGGTITIAVKNLNLLQCNGCDVESSGPIVSDTLNFNIHAGSLKMKDILISNYLGINATNLGKYQLSGRATFVNLQMTNLIDYEGYNLITDSTYVNSYNALDCEVNATKVLNVFINASGGVKYKGDPPIVRLTATGGGKLTKK